MTSFETLEKFETEFGTNNFLRVARKIHRREDGTDVEFIALARGYLDTQGSRRYKTNLTVPPDEELLAFLVDGLQQLQEGST